MQRSTTSGRRHSRAGSVSVAELIRKQPAPVRTPSPGRAAAHGPVTGPVTDPVTDPGADPPVRGPRPSARRGRRARLVGVAAGAALVLASVAAASLLAAHRGAGPDEPRVEAPGPISGASALRPDVLAERLGVNRPDGLPLGASPVAEDLPSPLGDDVHAILPTGPKPQVEAVRRFFELLPSKPVDASRLLSPDLLGDSAREFVAAWRGVRAITIESTSLRPDGAVLAVVSVQESGGDWMRVEQLFRLTDTTVPRIVDAEVLSAQRK
ncbi:hypothetical protein ACFFSW_31915 [Saccharothrix longispora]|uniref:Uncharacterized protein n=1 Tax=Saccharothrix longispora TaxID=33920 RepID=A0ABU1Q1H6_9PSEU|nr:hypothetical protein [Saccharothrix longispora]MDR6596755.1 hypothetical protein [Saccharothrix longispora]